MAGGSRKLPPSDSDRLTDNVKSFELNIFLSFSYVEDAGRIFAASSRRWQPSSARFDFPADSPVWLAHATSTFSPHISLRAYHESDAPATTPSLQTTFSDGVDTPLKHIYFVPVQQCLWPFLLGLCTILVAASLIVTMRPPGMVIRSLSSTDEFICTETSRVGWTMNQLFTALHVLIAFESAVSNQGQSLSRPALTANSDCHLDRLLGFLGHLDETTRPNTIDGHLPPSS